MPFFRLCASRERLPVSRAREISPPTDSGKRTTHRESSKHAREGRRRLPEEIQSSRINRVDFKLALDDWPESGLSRFSPSRGLGGSEPANLVSVGRMPGRSPVVTIRVVGSANG